jgi:hypothetical protein
LKLLRAAARRLRATEALTAMRCAAAAFAAVMTKQGGSVLTKMDHELMREVNDED